MFYEASGSIRGTCPHKHRTISGLARCILQDRRGCKSQGGFSDRKAVWYSEPTGYPLPLREEDRRELENLLDA